MDNLYSSIFTSSLFIFAMVLIRAVSRKKTSMRLQYALWLLVAAKLLVFPVPLAESQVSVQKLFGAWENTSQKSPVEITGREPQDTRADFQQEDAVSNFGKSAQESGDLQPGGTKRTGIKQLCISVAGIGCILMFFYFLAGNLRFTWYLHRMRMPFAANGFPLPVYLAEELPSPCLYGRAVYITLDVAADQQQLLHVLTHEYCHYRQGDPFWSTVRCLCLVCYWWNPLVWLAAHLSKQDCELACDEAALRLLGEKERLPYGRTLLGLAIASAKPKDYFTIAMTMAGGNRMKQRIQKIAQKSKVALPACILAALLSLACFISVSTARPASETAETADMQTDHGSITETGNAEKDKGFLAAEEPERDKQPGIAEETEKAKHGYFVKCSGTGIIPVAMEFSYDDRQGYELEAYRMPRDGAEYLASIHEMFPEDLWEECCPTTETYAKTYAGLKKQEERYTKRYLERIGREAAVGDHPDALHPLLTDAGFSVKVSNLMSENRKISAYPYWIGNLERIEDGVRYQYAMALDKKAQEIVYTKSEYDTGKAVEILRFDMNTGEEISP